MREGGIMQIRRVISAWTVVAALGCVPVLPAFQAEDTTKTVTKKAKKAKKDTGETATQAEPPSVETAKKAASTPAKIVPDSDIAAAKASGKVWVNTDTGVYHKGGQWYGATKQGKFMTEQDAIKAGYRSAKTK
jgi:hypothetical protein